MLAIDVNLSCHLDIPDLNKQKINITSNSENIKNHFMFSSRTSSLAGIIKIPPKDNSLSYAQLPRTVDDEKKIRDLITTMGTNGKISLLLHHEKRLNKIGDELRYLHPFKFLGYIFSNGDLKKYMEIIFDDYFKRINFVKDFSQTMDVYDLKNQLIIYLQGFANEVNISYDRLLPLIKNKNWEEFVKFLISN